MSATVIKPGMGVVKAARLYTLVCKSCECVFATDKPEWNAIELTTNKFGGTIAVHAPSLDCPECRGGVSHIHRRGGEGKENRYIQTYERVGQ